MRPIPFERIAVVGSVAAGKTALSAALAEWTGIAHIDVDSLRYADDWSEIEAEEVRRRFVDVVGRPRWILDGNSADMQDLAWVRGDLLIWLDYSLVRTMWSVLARSGARLVSRERFSGGMQEQISRLFGRRSIIRWAAVSHRPRRQRYQNLLLDDRYGHLVVKRLRRPAELEEWLDELLGPDRQAVID